MHKTRQFLSPLLLGLLLGGIGVRLALSPRAAPPAAPNRVLPAPPPAPVTPSPEPALQIELARITRENAGLAAELTAARTRLDEQDAALAATRENLEELRRPLGHDVLSSTVNARLKSGEAVVTGGYLLPGGGRLYAFVQPELIDVDGSPQVRIQGRFSLLDDETGATVGLDSIATNAANTLQHGEVWIRDEIDAVLGTLARTPGTLGITMADITVRPGGTATLQLEDPMLTLKVTPSPTGTGDDMDLEVRLEQTPPPPTPPATEQPPSSSSPQPAKK